MREVKSGGGLMVRWLTIDDDDDDDDELMSMV